MLHCALYSTMYCVHPSVESLIRDIFLDLFESFASSVFCFAANILIIRIHHVTASRCVPKVPARQDWACWQDHLESGALKRVSLCLKLSSSKQQCHTFKKHLFISQWTPSTAAVATSVAVLLSLAYRKAAWSWIAKKHGHSHNKLLFHCTTWLLNIVLWFTMAKNTRCKTGQIAFC